MELQEVKNQINVQLEILSYLQSDIYYNSNEGEGFYSTQEHIEQQVKDTIYSLIDLITKTIKGMDNETYNFIMDVGNKLTNNKKGV